METLLIFLLGVAAGYVTAYVLSFLRLLRRVRVLSIDDLKEKRRGTSDKR